MRTLCLVLLLLPAGASAQLRTASGLVHASATLQLGVGGFGLLATSHPEGEQILAYGASLVGATIAVSASTQAVDLPVEPALMGIMASQGAVMLAPIGSALDHALGGDGFFGGLFFGALGAMMLGTYGVARGEALARDPALEGPAHLFTWGIPLVELFGAVLSIVTRSRDLLWLAPGLGLCLTLVSMLLTEVTLANEPSRIGSSIAL